MRDPRLERLPPKSVAAVLAELAEHRDAPAVTIDLGGTKLERAAVIGVSFPTDGPRAALVLVGEDVAYVAVEAIRALVVHVTPENAHCLGFGRLRALRGDVPDRTAIVARANELGAGLGLDVAIGEHDESEEVRADVVDAISAVFAALRAIAADGVSISASISSLSITFERETTTLRQQALHVGFAVDRGALVGRSVDELRLSIESQL